MQFGGYALRFYFFTNYRYVQLVAEHVMTKGIRDQVDVKLLHRYSHADEVETFFVIGSQVDALKQGFHELIPSVRFQLW